LAFATAALLFSFLVLPSASALTTTSFTTTADFDGGTKQDPSDGNFGTETVTDNPGITANQLELSSLKGDAFTYADANADTFKWDNGPDANLPGDETRTITAGRMDLDVGTCPGVCIIGDSTKLVYSGDWDVEIAMNPDADGAGEDQHEIGGMNEQGRCSGATMDGTLMIYANLNILYSYRCLNGALALQASTAVSADPIWLRVTRATDTFTSFWSADGIVWTQHAQYTTAGMPNPMAVVVTMTGIAAGSPGALLDNLRQNTGTLVSPGVRTTGTWTTTTITIPAGEVLNQVSWTDANEAAGVCINLVELIVLGAVVETFAGCPASPVIPTVTTVGSASVRFTLISAGASTANIQDVELRSDVVPPSGSGDDDLLRLPVVKGWLERLVAAVFVFGTAITLLSVALGRFVTKRARQRSR